MTRAGIPTTHRATRFRSRLEARWAAFFDTIGWRWEYEPFDLNGYIPDFAIFGAEPFLVEVKPYSSIADCFLEQLRLPACDGYAQLVVGISPLLDVFGGEPSDAPNRWWTGGSLWSERAEGNHLSHWTCTAHWSFCSTCHQLVIEALLDGPICPCGHEVKIDPWVTEPLLEEAWAYARNVTQWKP